MNFQLELTIHTLLPIIFMYGRNKGGLAMPSQVVVGTQWGTKEKENRRCSC